MKGNKSPRVFLSRRGFGLTLCLGSVLVLMLMSCGERMETPVAMPSEGAADMRERVPMAPQAPDAGLPFVKEVGYYHDHKWTKPLTDTVSAGKTIFVKVVFSEGMKLKVSDTKEARPILYYRIAGKLTRFRIAGFGAKGEDFVSGDAKPILTQATYLCKYVVKPKDEGIFTTAVGKLNVDRQGNPMKAFYTHKETLSIGASKPKPTLKPTQKPTLPSPGTLVLVPARDSGTRGDNITNHTTLIIAGKLTKKPPQGTSVQLYHNGIALPDATDTTIDPKNRWSVEAVLPEGTHTLTARSEKGIATSVETEPLILTVDTTPPTAEATAHLHGNILIAAIAGKGVAAYRYAVLIGDCDQNTDFSDPIEAKAVLNEDITAFPAATLSLCVIGEDAAGNRQVVPTVTHIEKVTPAGAEPPKPEPEPEPEPAPAKKPKDIPPEAKPEAEPEPAAKAQTPQESPEPAAGAQTPPQQNHEPDDKPVDLVLPVELSHFQPARDKATGQVVITWATQSELNNAGFFIKRSNQRDGEFKVINATMIAGAGTTSEKQFYTYTDTTAKPNIVYYYQIEDISLDGNRQTLTQGIRLRGHIDAAGRLTSTWGELKASNKE